MQESEQISHSISALVATPARHAFEFMCDLTALGRWALGALNTQPDGDDGVYVGQSIFDGSQAWLHVEADESRYLVDYHVGSRENRQPRISARVIARDDNSCIITMSAWRQEAMSVTRWHQLCRAHEVEILIIRAHCEQRLAAEKA